MPESAGSAYNDSLDDAIGAVDIGGSKVALGVVDSDGGILARSEVSCPALCQAGAQGLRALPEALAEMAVGAGVRIRGVGIACTGPVDPWTGVIGDVGTIPGWNGLNLVETFSVLDVPVAVENDADASALAEAVWGCGRGAGAFLYVTLSTGIGCGLVFDGSLYRGVGGAHPEIGHHIVDLSGPRCYCGANGCWEALASGPSLASWFAGETNRQGVSAQEVCRLARNGDEMALRAVARTARYVGAGLSNLITIFVPDTIALGGGLMKSWDLFENGAMEMIRKCCTQVPASGTRVVCASLGDRLPVLGAARVWIHRYGRGPI